MIQIGPIKYIHKEEETVVSSILAGVLIGIPSGWLLSYSTGFLKLTLAGDGAAKWTAVLLGVGLIFVATSWVTAIVTCVLVSRRNGIESKKQIGKMIFGTVLVPLAWLLAVFVAGLVSAPIDSFLHNSFGITQTYAIDILVFAPFVMLSGAVIVPDSRLGKALRRFLSHMRRHMKSD